MLGKALEEHLCQFWSCQKRKGENSYKHIKPVHVLELLTSWLLEAIGILQLNSNVNIAFINNSELCKTKGVVGKLTLLQLDS